VLRTRVGYAGGSTENPSYRRRGPTPGNTRPSFSITLTSSAVSRSRARLPTEQALVHSTLAARLNAVAGGYESYEELERELPIFGLGSEQEGLLRDVIRRSRD
jgi:hypothetical protein